MILVFLIILLIGLSVLKLFWSKYNALMNFRGGKMLKRNSVLLKVADAIQKLCFEPLNYHIKKA